MTKSFFTMIFPSNSELEFKVNSKVASNYEVEENSEKDMSAILNEIA